VCQIVHYKMKNHTINPETLRKRNSKQKETPKERAARLKRERERKRQKRAEETDEARDARLTKAREQKNRKRAAEFIDEREKRLAHERVYKRTTRNSDRPNPVKEHQNRIRSTRIHMSDHQRLISVKTDVEFCRNSVPKWIVLSINFVPYVTNESHQWCLSIKCAVVAMWKEKKFDLPWIYSRRKIARTLS